MAFVLVAEAWQPLLVHKDYKQNHRKVSGGCRKGTNPKRNQTGRLEGRKTIYRVRRGEMRLSRAGAQNSVLTHCIAVIKSPAS